MAGRKGGDTHQYTALDMARGNAVFPAVVEAVVRRLVGLISMLRTLGLALFAVPRGTGAAMGHKPRRLLGPKFARNSL